MQDSKTLPPKVRHDSGNVKDVKDEQPANALYSMAVTESGIFIDGKFEQSKKQPSPIISILSSIVKDSNELQNAKKHFGKEVMVDGIVTVLSE